MQLCKSSCFALVVAALLSLATAVAMAGEGSPQPNHSASGHNHRHMIYGQLARVGWMETVAYGPNGATTTKRRAIDMHVYVRSGGTLIVPARPTFKATRSGDNLASSYGCLDYQAGACGSGPDDGDPPPVPNPDDPPSTVPDIGPGTPGPDSPAPESPIPPFNTPCNVGKITFTQFYNSGGNKWVQTSEYRRSVYDAGNGQCSNGPWSQPIINQHPAK